MGVHHKFMVMEWEKTTGPGWCLELDGDFHGDFAWQHLATSSLVDHGGIHGHE